MSKTALIEQIKSNLELFSVNKRREVILELLVDVSGEPLPIVLVKSESNKVWFVADNDLYPIDDLDEEFLAQLVYNLKCVPLSAESLEDWRIEKEWKKLDFIYKDEQEVRGIPTRLGLIVHDGELALILVNPAENTITLSVCDPSDEEDTKEFLQELKNLEDMLHKFINLYEFNHEKYQKLAEVSKNLKDSMEA